MASDKAIAKRIIKLFADGDEKHGIWGYDTEIYENWDAAISDVLKEITKVRKDQDQKARQEVLKKLVQFWKDRNFTHEADEVIPEFCLEMGWTPEQFNYEREGESGRSMEIGNAGNSPPNAAPEPAAANSRSGSHPRGCSHPRATAHNKSDGWGYVGKPNRVCKKCGKGFGWRPHPNWTRDTNYCKECRSEAARRGAEAKKRMKAEQTGRRRKA